ncbi:MAG: histidine--tRNA ligase, partial [Brachymonas sp.]|nr:histidine--tRNA ligase [Brachymonas sp.]
MAEKILAVKGMNDILPPGIDRKDKLFDSGLWSWFDLTVHRVMQQYGYQGIVAPVVEPTSLFARGLGEVTDIVEKEMFSWTDAMNGDQLTLRPEGTAGIVRAMIEHNALYNGPLRLWLMGPMFRHERPQKGRYRQFHQLDVEALGLPGPDVDVEIILLARRLMQALGLKNGEHFRLELNCLGQANERAEHRKALIAYLEQHQDVLDAEAKRRMYTNPLRVLDTKNPAMQAMVEAAPSLIDFLGAESKAHFDGVCQGLDAVGQTYRINPRIVRGMDYYSLTVFEWVTDHLGAQGTVCGGGRYDGLFEQLGGKPTPAIGFGMGIERVLLLIQDLGLPIQRPTPDAFAIIPDAQQFGAALATVETLREHGISVLMHAGGGSFKNQFKKADASGARYALVFGADELAEGCVTIKHLRDGNGQQWKKPLAEL